jgi:UDP-GlcNAc:undecaprenyl-phosphate GlcNAc-1-phosphate transferase
MRTYLVAFVLSLLCSLVLTKVLRDLANRLQIVDTGGGRKIHKKPIPRLGGVAVTISMALPLIGLSFWQNDISREMLADQPLLISLLGGGGVMFVAGVFDDLTDARALVKLGAQITAALIVFYAGIRIEAVSVPFFSPVQLGILSLPATVFWLVLVMNAVNLIDGLDGLAGGVVVLAGGTLFVMSVIEDNVLAALLLAVVVGGTMGFLAYNVSPASIFLGDTGSLVLGFLLALSSVHSAQKSYTLFSILAALLALGLPIFDLGMAVVRRFLSGRPLFSGDQHHIHHILLRKGFSQSQSALVLFGGAIVLEVAALTFIYADDRLSALAIAALVPSLFVVVRLLGYGDIIRSARRATALEEVDGKLRARASSLGALRQALREAEGLDAGWAAVVAAAPALGLDRVELLTAEGAPLRAWATEGALRTEVHLQSLFVRDLALHGLGGAAQRVRFGGHAEAQLLEPVGELVCLVVTDGLVDLLRRAPWIEAGEGPA